MWKKSASVAVLPWRMIASPFSSNVSSTVNAKLLRSLKESYYEVSKMTPPPKVGPPSPFTVVKGALDSPGPVLKRTYNNEDISISVMELDNTNIYKDGDDEPLLLHVIVSKPTQELGLFFLCGINPDGLAVQSVCMRPIAESSDVLMVPDIYSAPAFEDLNEKMRLALNGYIQKRGINKSLYPFLHAFLYVKDHRKRMRWFKSVGMLLTDPKQATTNM